MTWQIYIAHDINDWGETLCWRARLGRDTRLWNVAQDAGRVPLCEKCRKKIQKSFRSKPITMNQLEKVLKKYAEHTVTATWSRRALIPEMFMSK